MNRSVWLWNGVLLKGVGECGTAEDVCTPILGEPKVGVDNLIIGNIVRRAADRPSIRPCSRTVLSTGALPHSLPSSAALFQSGAILIVR